MNKLKIIRVVLLLAILGTAVMIFLFSSQPADESQKTSDKLTTTVIRIVDPQFEKKPKPRQLSTRKLVSLIIRKLAHFSEFALLGALLYAYLRLSPRPGTAGRALLIALVLAALYACTDEAHQMLVEGRGPSPVDVGIDTLGALTAILITAGLWRHFSRRGAGRQSLK